jgi:hypothetical protein
VAPALKLKADAELDVDPLVFNVNGAAVVAGTGLFVLLVPLAADGWPNEKDDPVVPKPKDPDPVNEFPEVLAAATGT